ncbi:MAG: gliding motility-associated ABC transporter ATP-binding subunit GldA [Saprospiraceae bacterium]|nr:gliding motility-associated ABC transporter ATP-binding subunit GldA [Saprospiraceae bacterium]MCB9323571.1 gliding motility-associated ABC transporter ATP-binding subunit GldA [Lewinellaceae bacterium]
MSVSVKGLTKVYGDQKAIDNINFEAKKGEILGFLGPNGAGKTTTMKILTSFIPPTAGEASVCGFNVQEEEMEVRKRIGYLPEHNPLYKDMYVKEYLRFIGGLHKIKNMTSRVDEMIELTGLEREQKKLIGDLSKGYRQRVGLAQAMIHDPEVLILDEPTTGLDPNQLAEIRALIKKTGQDKTVIFSTHIMQEVQALCDRVLIINKGKLVANNTIDELQSRITGETIITVEFDQQTSEQKLKSIIGVKKVKADGKNRWKLSTDLDADHRTDVFHFAVKEKLTLLEMHKEDMSVEDIFRSLTK